MLYGNSKNINTKFQRVLLGQSAQTGAILPIMMGLGLIMVVVGLTMIMRASEEELTTKSQKSTAKSQGIAETAITRYQALINNYPVLASYCANASTQSPCDSGITWSNITENILSQGKIDACDGSSTVTSSEVTQVQAAANTNWQYVDSSDPNKGQYRLVEYTYDPNGSEGNLTVESQVSGSHQKLQVTIPVIDSVSTPPSTSSLWINYNKDADASGSVAIRTDIQDSTCPVDEDVNRVAKLKEHQSSTYVPTGEVYNYLDTPGLEFPALPSSGATPPASDYYAKTEITIAGGDPPKSLPAVGEIPTDGVITYYVTNQVSLSGGSDLTLGTGSETIVLYVAGDITLSSGSSINVVPGSKLIVYAHGKVTLSSGSTTNAIENLGNLEDVQFYVYSSNDIALSGGSGMKMFLFAPNSKVVFSSDSNFNGTIWSKSWKGSGSAVILGQEVDVAKTLVGSLSNQVQPTSSWQRQEL